MADDIVTRLRAEGEMEPVGDGTKVWWSSKICQEAANEIERLRASVINTSDNAFDEIERLRDELRRVIPFGDSAWVISELMADRDIWKRTCTKLVGMMLPYSLLMNETEREELKIILGASNNE